MSTEADYFFILSIIGLGIGVIHYIVRSCYNTKCNNIDICCGCIRLTRDIEQETRNTEFKIEHGIRGSIEDGDNNINITQPQRLGV